MLLVLFSVFTAFLSFLYIIHIFNNVALHVDKKPLRPFMDRWINDLENSAFSFFASLLLIFSGLYLMVCALRGNVKMGLRFFVVSFYTVVPRETFVNSFMANCLVMNLWMVSLTQFMVIMFKSYLRGTQIAKIFEVQVRHMYFFWWTTDRNFFVIFAIVWWHIFLFYFILKPYEKMNLGRKLKRGDMAAKH